MIKTIYLLIIFSLCFLPEAEAKKSALDTTDYFPETSKLINPFLPQFIKKEIKKTTPEKIKTTPEQPYLKPKKITKKQTYIKKPKPIHSIVAFPDISVSGLIWNSNRPQAIVNQEVVESGDTVEEATIIEITKKGITVEFNGEIKTFTP